MHPSRVPGLTPVVVFFWWDMCYSSLLILCMIYFVLCVFWPLLLCLCVVRSWVFLQFSLTSVYILINNRINKKSWYSHMTSLTNSNHYTYTKYTRALKLWQTNHYHLNLFPHSLSALKYVHFQIKHTLIWFFKYVYGNEIIYNDNYEF